MKAINFQNTNKKIQTLRLKLNKIRAQILEVEKLASTLDDLEQEVRVAIEKELLKLPENK